MRTAGRQDVAALAAMLARAFGDDPVQAWLFPPEVVERSRRIAALFDLLLRHVYLAYGETWMTVDGASTAVWAPPGAWQIPVAVQLRRAPNLIRLFGRRLPGVLRGLRRVEAEHPSEPHWYLAVLGTDPSGQGHGFASVLLSERLRRCDATGTPAYLESSKESNLAFYGRHGFRVTGEVQLPDGPPVWPMWRDPQPQG